MPYEVEPEQDLLDLPEADVYEELLDIRAKFNSVPNGATVTAEKEPIVIYNVKNIIEGPRTQRKSIKS